MPTKVGKYGNRKTVASDGSVLDSKREARRYEELLALQKIGVIRDLKRQVVYPLILAHKEFNLRECNYVADFVFTDEDGRMRVEDAKGHRTRDYIIKRKLFAQVYGLLIEEV